MTIERSAWEGALTDEWTGPVHIVRLEGVAGQGTSGSGAFKGLTDDGHYWIKPVNNLQSPRVPVTDYVLGRMGKLIDAPVCHVAVVKIPVALAGTEFRPGLLLQEGLAFGSREVPDVKPEPDRVLAHAREDDNAWRHAGIFAFVDWCWGGDDQWLYEVGNENRIHSHDHGHFLPDGPDWTSQALEQHVDDAHRLQGPIADLSIAALEQYAERLETVTREEIRAMLVTVPPRWDVEQEDLETLGWFLERRAVPVAERLRDIAGSLKGGGR